MTIQGEILRQIFEVLMESRTILPGYFENIVTEFKFNEDQAKVLAEEIYTRIFVFIRESDSNRLF